MGIGVVALIIEQRISQAVKFVKEIANFTACCFKFQKGAKNLSLLTQTTRHFF